MTKEKYTVHYPTKNHIQGMLNLNYKIYPEDWHVSPVFVERVMNKNPYVYRIIEVDGEVKGIYSMFPLNQEVYEAILSGEMDEKHLDSYILDYASSEEAYLYFISMIVDIYDSERKAYAKQLIRDIPKRLNEIETMGTNIKEIGAIAISEEGERIASKIGFAFTGKYVSHKEEKFPVFRGQKEDFTASIQEANKNK
ncbi:hypothetical protein SAMN04487936_10744 [Halobacillus dabanensis]|uniref:N-acetyltransferase domain-containing protein n=1 Tax=Halobacillus dabanensis TaxID=240302 RepID=A0A1I3WNL6_HALDA|nr:hypothetical protein [Halobacillus dabanensis]SFK08769.1 hypothetical protein SAMN04487936_10744 [Halobacillus dabanensis]